MRRPSDAGPSEPSSTLWTFSVSQGLQLHVSKAETDWSSRMMRKYDFRLLTPSGHVSLYRRGLTASGVLPSVAEGDPLVACGKQCVLSVRAERCFTKPEGEKEEAEEEGRESERGEGDADRSLEEPGVWNNTRSGQRAHSGVMRTRVWVTLTPRPSTAPQLTQRGGRGEHQLRADSSLTHMSISAGHRPVWGSENGHQGHQITPEWGDGLNPVHHLFLPSCHPSDPEPEDMRKVAERLEADGEQTMRHDSAEQEMVTVQRRRHVSDDTTGECSAGNDEECPGLRLENMMDVVSAENEQRFEAQHEVIREPGEEASVPEKDEEQEHGSDNGPPSAQKSGTPQIRAPKSKSPRRQTLSASALMFPCTFTNQPSSPTPPFYSPSFGVRTPLAPKPRPTKVKRTIHNRPSSGTKTRDVSHVDARGSRPKIMSSVRGSASRKTKTTKTFEWGPEGPQETKSVCELHARMNRCRGSD